MGTIKENGINSAKIPKTSLVVKTKSGEIKEKNPKSVVPMEKTLKEKKPKNKKLIKIIIIAGAIVLVLVAGTLLVSALGTPPVKSFKTTPLKTISLTDSIAVTGVVESANAMQVYSKVTGYIKQVTASVGDEVNKGDMLCKLDTETLELDIAQSQASLQLQENSAQFQIDTSTTTYENAKKNLEKNLNAQVATAQNSMKSAKKALDDAKDSFEGPDSTQAAQASAAVSNAYHDLSTAQSSLDTAIKEYNTAAAAEASKLILFEATREEFYKATPTDLDYVDKRIAFEKAQADYTAAKSAAQGAETKKTTSEKEVTAVEKTLRGAQDSYNASISTYSYRIHELEKGYETSKINYENAVKQLSVAKNSAKIELSNYENAIAGNELSANFESQKIALNKLLTQLNNCSISAPVNGTVTAVFAKDGGVSNGLLFVIEDTKDLKIKTNIKEYDIHKVKPGLTVKIKSDATEETENLGKLKSIAPTANKNMDGSTQSGTNVEFEAVIAVDQNQQGLCIGMNTRLSIVIDEKQNVYAVSYDSVVEKPNGSKVVYAAVANPDKETEYIAREIPVTTGLETDFYIEIESSMLVDGMLIIANAEGVIDGETIALGDPRSQSTGNSMFPQPPRIGG